MHLLQLYIVYWGSFSESEEIQWNLDLSFFKGMEKQNDECGKMINPGNYYTS